MIKHSQYIGEHDDTNVFTTGQVMYNGKTVTSTIASIYGISYKPPIGAYAVTLHADGKEENRISLVDDPANAFNPQGFGELQVGNYVTRSNVYFTASGDIIINGGSSNVIINSGNVVINSNVTINGALTVTGNATIAAKSFIGHTHTGVQSGSNNTGAVT